MAGRATFVEVTADAPIPETLDALLIVGPQQPVPESHQLALDQYVMGGGATGWFVASWGPDFSTAQTRAIDHGLAPMLGRWGITPTQQIVLDRTRNERMALPINDQWLQVNTPLAPVSLGWDPVFRPVRDLKQAALPFATTLVLQPNPRVDHQIWLRSESTAVAVPGPTSLDPRRLAGTMAGEAPGPWPLVAALQGTLPSHLAHLAPPASNPLTESKPVRMVVAGSADLVANQPDLLRNTVDWLLADHALLSIRARTHALPHLDPPNNTTTWALRLAIPGFGLWALAMITLLVRKFSP